MDAYHIPALLDACMEGLQINPEGKYADVTFGGGGHSKAIRKRLTSGQLIAFDKDKDAKKNAEHLDNIIFVQHSFSHLKRFLKYHKMIPLDGILADLGISSWQINNPSSGFSTRFDDSPLDMRMGKNAERTASFILMNYSESALTEIFSRYGEIRNSKSLAHTIVQYRNIQPIETTADLKKAIAKCVFKEEENRYYAQLFQALRIEVNNEMDELKQFLLQSAEVLKKGGRLAVISYHSLEDRIVKNFFSKGNFEGEESTDVFGNRMGLSFKALTRKPVVPDEAELIANPRVRSAKLRIAEKI